MQPDRTLAYYLNTALYRLDHGELASEMEVERTYRRLAGDLISRLTQSVLLSGGTLYLRVASAALRHELFKRRESLRRHINQEVGSETVRNIVIR